MPAIASERTAPARRTIRYRLTLLYGVLFLICGAALLGITYGLVAQTTQTTRVVSSSSGTELLQPGPQQQPLGPSGAAVAGGSSAYIRTQVDSQRSLDLRQLLIWSGVALGITVVGACLLGWWTAGRALRPIRLMITKAQQLSERNLHERLAVTGPNDELKDLGDTFDGLLGRLESAFEAQTRFVANASHELRTPLTVQRAMIEVALADPDADVKSLSAVCRRVLAVGEDQARMIDALLTLARSQRGLDRWEPVDVADVAAEVLQRQPSGANVKVDTVLGPAHTVGDRRLMERLIANLVDNAVRHNVNNGWVAVWTGRYLGHPILRVVNTGAVIPQQSLGTLFQPFQRLETRTGHHGGLGLGLSIVAAIAAAHGATLEVEARPEGGLAVTVTFGTADTPARTLTRTPALC